MNTPHCLILGGTGDARQLAQRLAGRADLRVTLSLAGRTKTPLPQAVTTRVGGFGGAAGLAEFLRTERVDLLVDATHPFAAQISANAFAAAQETGTPLLALDRPVWTKAEGDDWIEVDDVAAAAAAISGEGRTVFLTIGRQELAPFAAYPQHRTIIRSVDPADVVLPNSTIILDRGPFDAAAEERLMRAHGIEVVVSKNSGGDATYGKIIAARKLGLPVIMVKRPQPSGARSVSGVQSVEDWIEAHVAAFAERGA
ncbi:cobalt-precorrin-6A reductase [Tianweitania sp. BSSL-BM11]|uniref:Cobalt-precorrin-6A reductase n=1 Tax=Tianweitania aestuarii TaxID=2814886 RepID=A0ABS5RU54_9HYPH|nr:cobalt-precorrin-6A reductase [Tianweitania aestuarii]MBS9720588.1 cobalt-precorrin-6A reductase [Tianweitania aestuarii]